MINKAFRYVLFILVIAFSFSAYSADKLSYPVSEIADSLKKNAYAVVRLNRQDFVQSDINHAVYKYTKVITVLNKQGEEYGDFSFSGDKFRELSSFSGIVRDAAGNVVRKIKKSDLITSTISDGALATDAVDIMYSYKSAAYPYTVEYECQEKWKNGIVVYPPFYPYLGFYTSVESSSIRIEVPSNLTLRKYSSGDLVLSEEKTAASVVYTASAENLPAVEYEALSPSYRAIFPRTLMAPSDFCYDSYCGNMTDWKNYGLWVNGLLKGRDQLPPALVDQLKNMTVQYKTSKEKVKAVFEYMQKNTRYVSIQLGIGGFQPMDAMTVSKSGFSDCKGLTNYMGALLKAIDIPSYYCVISLKEKELFADYPNFNQADHVILMVPDGKDSLWLECTNQTLPFGYIHQDIAGHDALVITSEGGVLKRLPSYTDKENKIESAVKLVLDENGGVTGDLALKEYLDGFEQSFSVIESNDRERLIRYINSNVQIPKVQVGQIEAFVDKSQYPSVSLSAPFTAADFASKTGSRLFVPIYPMKQSGIPVLTAQNRAHDIYISKGFTDTISITFVMPEGFDVESLPKEMNIDSSFGLFTCKSEKKDNRILYNQMIDIYSGQYDKSKYKEIKDFFNKINSALKQKMVLKKL